MMNPATQVSLAVVIPNYNHASFLGGALESVVTQSLQPAAVHVIDDASTDGSLEVVRPYAERYPHVHLHVHSSNQGVLPTLNAFLPRLSQTHFLALAADDGLCPNCIQNAHKLLSTHPQAGIVLADLLDLYPDGATKRFSYRLSTEPTFFPPDQVPRVARGLGLAGQCFMRVDALRRMGGFPERLRWHADHFACWVLAARHGLGYTPEVGGMFRKTATSFSAQGTHSPAQRDVLEGFLDHLNRPEFADVRPALRDGHFLAIFGEDLFATLWRSSGHRDLLTPSFVSRLVQRRLRGWIRHPIPVVVKRWLRSRFRRSGSWD